MQKLAIELGTFRSSQLLPKTSYVSTMPPGRPHT
jgi:hypothetical protein